MYVETVPNPNARPTILFREGRRVRQRTLANLARWPPAKIKVLRRAPQNETLVAP